MFPGIGEEVGAHRSRLLGLALAPKMISREVREDHWREGAARGGSAAEVHRCGDRDLQLDLLSRAQWETSGEMDLGVEIRTGEIAAYLRPRVRISLFIRIL